MYLCGQQLIRRPKTPQPPPEESQTTYEHLFYRRSLTPAFARPNWIPNPNRVDPFIKDTFVAPLALDSSSEDSSDSSSDDSFMDDTDNENMDGIEEYSDDDSSDDDSFDYDVPMDGDSSDDDSSDNDSSDDDALMENSSSDSKSSDDESSDDDLPKKMIQWRTVIWMTTISSCGFDSFNHRQVDVFWLFQIGTLQKLKRLNSSSHHLQRLPSPVFLVQRRSFHITSIHPVSYQFTPSS
ncbi:hypothetical protein B9Z55_022485 [Caenorhabditis nigoni]|uniref:Uncharacterized protein n=1 Tax=Caenorhabditis nigoni TaxID=1611254 RepID=A0A2G5SKB1_9PELO|nr:hypothetical protein B9Z55_022485 [Caenorhabditis nigoni]